MVLRVWTIIVDRPRLSARIQNPLKIPNFSQIFSLFSKHTHRIARPGRAGPGGACGSRHPDCSEDGRCGAEIGDRRNQSRHRFCRASCRFVLTPRRRNRFRSLACHAGLDFKAGGRRRPCPTNRRSMPPGPRGCLEKAPLGWKAFGSNPTVRPGSRSAAAITISSANWPGGARN
jgi:hypothetical protein